ncbi:MAG: inverse autotransporter beta domain-containing protein [Kiritimatiellae bacterium]|nr:inverse autotransporter beta domain-containing protein [Kiritimatiellia bacterium]
MKKYEWSRRSLAARCLIWAVALHTMALQCLPGYIAVAQAKEAAEEAAAELPLPELSLGVRGAEDIFEGFGDVLAPVWYSPKHGMIFLNPRVSAKDEGEEEANLGLGWRQIFSVKDYPFIAGANVYYDSRWTQYDNHFNQLGLGVEFLSEWVDARANYYRPDDDEELAREWTTAETAVSSSSHSSTRLVDAGPVIPVGNQFVQEVTWERRRTTVTRTTTTTYFWEQFEAALEGYDCEIGFKIPGLDEYLETRVFIGYQDFDTPFAEEDLEGAKARLEVRALPGLTLDAEWFEEERLNGTDYMVGGRVHLPFDIANIANGKNPFEGAGDRFKKTAEAKLANRLTEMVMRDVKIQTQISEAIEKIEERVTSTLTSRSTKRSRKTTDEVILDDCTFVDQDNMGDPAMNGSYEHPFDVIQNGVNNANSPVYVDFSDYGPYYENVIVPGGVQVYGSGTSIEGYGGRRYASTQHPVVIGNGNSPTFTITGDDVTIAGFRIQNPGAAYGLVSYDSPNGHGPYDVTRAGMASRNNSRLIIRDNIFEGVSYGAVFVDTLADDQDKFVADFIGNDFDAAGATYDGLVVDTCGASGVFDVFMRDNIFNANGDDGLFLDARNYDEAYLEIGGGEAKYNSGNGLDLNIEGIADFALLYLHDFAAYRNFDHNIQVHSLSSGGDAVTIFDNVSSRTSMYGDGIHFDGCAADAGGGIQFAKGTAGGQGLAVAAFNEIDASYNYGDGLYIGMDGARTFEGDAFFVVENTVANNNGMLNSGIHISGSGAHTHYGDASVLFDNVTANDNAGTGIFFGNAGAWTWEGNATVVMRDIQANNNFGFLTGIHFGWAVALAGGGVGKEAPNGVFGGGNATALFQGIEAMYNHGDGLFLGELGGASAYGGNAVFHMTDVNACYNQQNGIAFGMVGAQAMGGNADFFMGNITASYNGDYMGSGINFGLPNFTVAHAMGGDATAIFSGIEANYNAAYGIYVTSAGAVAGGGVVVNGINKAGVAEPMVNGDALLEFRNVDASYNGQGGIHFAGSGAVAGGSISAVPISPLIQIPSIPSGPIELGDATLRMINVTANGNGGFLSGIHFGQNGAEAGGLKTVFIGPVSGGHASLLFNNVTVDGNSGDGAYFGLYGALSWNGNADVRLKDVSASYNGGAASGIHFGYGGACSYAGNAVFKMKDCDVSFNSGHGVYFGDTAALSYAAKAVSSFDSVSAIGNSGFGLIHGGAYSFGPCLGDNARVKINNSAFEDNGGFGADMAVYSASGKATINVRDTAIRNNTAGGIEAANYGGDTTRINLGTASDPGHNSIEGNGGLGVQNDTPGVIATIAGNYWGGVAPVLGVDYNAGCADPGANWLATDPNP